MGRTENTFSTISASSGRNYEPCCCFHSNRYEEGWDVYGESSELKERFSSHHVNVLELLAKINSWKMWILCDREPVKN